MNDLYTNQLENENRQLREALKQVRISTNELAGDLYKKIDAQDKIIQQQIEEINQLQQVRYSLDRVELESRIDKAIEYIDNNSYEETYTDENGITWLRFKMDNVNDLKDILLGEKK